MTKKLCTNRRISRTIASVTVLVALGSLSACSSSDDQTELSESGGVAAESSSTATESSSTAGQSELRVVVMSVGTATDGAFGNAWSNAAEAAAEATGAQVEWVGSMDTPNQYLSQGASYATAGYDVVLLAHGGMMPVGEQLAAQFPDSQFCVAPIPEVDVSSLPDNLCVIDVKQEVGAFRAGVLAGLVTSSGVIASNQALPIPAISRQVAAFQLGARCVNADVMTLNELTNNDTDPSITKTASEAQVRQGADVLFGATGTAMNGMFEAAKQSSGVYAIGQYVDATSVAPTVILATTILNVEGVLAQMIADAQAGTLQPFRAYGLDGAVDVGYLVENEALFSELSPDQLQRHEDVQAAITDGSIRIPETADLVDEGAADQIDVTDLGCDPR